MEYNRKYPRQVYVFIPICTRSTPTYAHVFGRACCGEKCWSFEMERPPGATAPRKRNPLPRTARCVYRFRTLTSAASAPGVRSSGWCLPSRGKLPEQWVPSLVIAGSVWTNCVRSAWSSWTFFGPCGFHANSFPHGSAKHPEKTLRYNARVEPPP